MLALMAILYPLLYLILARISIFTAACAARLKWTAIGAAPGMAPFIRRSRFAQRLSVSLGGPIMARGDKSKYTEKQKRQAEHIEEQYKEDGMPEDEAERRAWATVNKTSGGGKKTGSGRGKAENTEPARQGGRKGGEAS
jgi:hypothetical protein